MVSKQGLLFPPEKPPHESGVSVWVSSALSQFPCALMLLTPVFVLLTPLFFSFCILVDLFDLSRLSFLASWSTFV